jgi:hypothetical protein
MDSLVQSCERSSEYPQNLVCHDALSHNLRMYYKKLSNESTRMFQNCHGEVDFLDLKVENDGMYLLLVSTATSAGKTANGAELRQNSNQIV